MAKPIELNESNFENTIKEGVVLVDFWAPWCGPCRMIAPVMEDLAEDYEGRAKITKVNTDENPKLLFSLELEGIPTILFFKRW